MIQLTRSILCQGDDLHGDRNKCVYSTENPNDEELAKYNNAIVKDYELMDIERLDETLYANSSITASEIMQEDECWLVILLEGVSEQMDNVAESVTELYEDCFEEKVTERLRRYISANYSFLDEDEVEYTIDSITDRIVNSYYHHH